MLLICTLLFIHDVQICLWTYLSICIRIFCFKYVCLKSFEQVNHLYQFVLSMCYFLRLFFVHSLNITQRVGFLFNKKLLSQQSYVTDPNNVRHLHDLTSGMSYHCVKRSGFLIILNICFHI